MEQSNQFKESTKRVAHKVKQQLNEKVLTDQNKASFLEVLNDIKQSLINVVKGLFNIKIPDQKKWKFMVLEEVIATGAGWTAGVIASDWVSSNFKFKNIKNGFGVFGKKDGKTMISKDDYEIFDWIASYFIGLVMIIIVRYFVIQLIEEYGKVRRERLHTERK